MQISFRFRIVPFIVSVVLVATGVSLAQWQTRRADEKQAIENMRQTRQSAPVLMLEQVPAEMAEIEFRRVQLRGQFISGWPIYLDNRPYKGQAGFYLAMPFKMAAGGQHVLVMRGWIPRDVADRTRLPPIVTPTGDVVIEGVVRNGIGQVMQLGEPDALRPGAIVQNLQLEELAKASGLSMAPLVVEQTDATIRMDDQLVRDWPLPSSGIDKHRGYAFQWYGLALMACVFFVVTGFRRGRT
ncbi:MAG: SURF1 family protein [Oxalicibacterium faecigallinarum]|uniref:SURF1 family protein n=1 Tax=Oxalicibacterium faecigallinarum TaxID=573741 RepID=UPI00280A2AEB|nr:SURF1 family protein [Oxalicibacterium faecigallinarum]MDQ7970105.1 SURF1 family protein [Oxalicibacterium faecigallinarum]